MIRYSFLLLFLITSCQKNWSKIEMNNFLERCHNSNLINSNKEDHEGFCQCILEESLRLEVPYTEFLNKDFTEFKKKQIINSCINDE